MPRCAICGIRFDARGRGGPQKACPLHGIEYRRLHDRERVRQWRDRKRRLTEDGEQGWLMAVRRHGAANVMWAVRRAVDLPVSALPPCAGR